MSTRDHGFLDFARNVPTILQKDVYLSNRQDREKLLLTKGRHMKV